MSYESCRSRSENVPQIFNFAADRRIQNGGEASPTDPKSLNFANIKFSVCGLILQGSSCKSSNGVSRNSIHNRGSTFKAVVDAAGHWHSTRPRFAMFTINRTIHHYIFTFNRQVIMEEIFFLLSLLKTTGFGYLHGNFPPLAS